MDIILLCIKAVFCGIAVAAPVGPMGVLCMRRTMTQGYTCGVFTAAGIALSDTTYSLLAVLGVTSISDFIQKHKYSFDICVGVFIILIGLNIYFSKSESEDQIALKTNIISLPYALFSATFLTLTNPVPLLFFVTIFTALVPQTGFSEVTGTLTVAGVFAGSFLWSLGIVASVSALRNIITAQRRLMIDKVTGLFLIVFGISEILHVF